jgi:hypothetical protein
VKEIADHFGIHYTIFSTVKAQKGGKEMTRKDKGSYGKKHSPKAKLNPAVAEAIKQGLSEEKISCAGAFRIAARLKIQPREVGIAIDLMETPIMKCQLGLFGYGYADKDIQAAETVSPAVEVAIRASLVKGKISCSKVWEIARKMKMGRKRIASACEALKIKISTCQLGTF